MINNLNLIKPLLEFPHKECFYFCQVLQRGKENPHLNMSNSRVIKTYYITSIKKLEDNFEEMVKLAEVFNARVYINLNPRNFEKAAFKLLQKVADQMMNKDFYNVRKAYDSICGEYHSEIDRRWLLDLDFEQLYLKDKIIQYVNLAHLTMDKHEKVSKYKIIAEIPSKTGIHIISNPFNKAAFSKEFPEIEIHSNNPTNLLVI